MVIGHKPQTVSEGNDTTIIIILRDKPTQTDGEIRAHISGIAIKNKKEKELSTNQHIHPD